MASDSVMTEAQESTWAYINNSWPIDTYVVDGSGYVQFVCDDGDTGWIDPEGEWGWDKY